MSNKKRKADKRASDRCAVARDLMVLYVDGMASEASQRRVNRHVKDCPPCKQVWEDMQTPAAPEPPAPVEDPQFDQAVRRVRSKQKWRSLRKVLLGVLIAAMMVLAALVAWWYWGEQVEIPWWEYELEAERLEDGRDFVRAYNVPTNARLVVRVDRDGYVHTWLTTNRATNLETCNRESWQDYFIFEREVLTAPWEAENRIVVTRPGDKQDYDEARWSFKLNALVRGSTRDAMAYQVYLTGWEMMDYHAAPVSTDTLNVCKAEFLPFATDLGKVAPTPLPWEEAMRQLNPMSTLPPWQQEYVASTPTPMPVTEDAGEQLPAATLPPEDAEVDDEAAAPASTPAALVVATMPPTTVALRPTPLPEEPAATPMPKVSTATEID